MNNYTIHNTGDFEYTITNLNSYAQARRVLTSIVGCELKFHLYENPFDFKVFENLVIYHVYIGDYRICDYFITPLDDIFYKAKTKFYPFFEGETIKPFVEDISPNLKFIVIKQFFENLSKLKSNASDQVSYLKLL